MKVSASYAPAMFEDRRLRGADRGMQVAVAYEHQRGAHVVDISRGFAGELTEVLRTTRRQMPMHPSADLLSTLELDTRVIEVKARGGYGPLTILERQLDTFVCAGDVSWLYVVWNTTQPQPEELWLVQDPSRLEWRETRAATKPSTEYFRGTRHEAEYQLAYPAVAAAGQRADLSVMDDAVITD